MLIPWRLARLLTFATMLLAAGCGAPSPTRPESITPPPNAGPSAAIALTVDSLGSAEAVTGVSEVTVDASRSSGTSLRYRIEFGDGGTASEGVSRHVYQAAGTYTVSVTIVDDTGRAATLTRELVVASPLGAWVFLGMLERSRTVQARTLTLTDQDGSSVRGTLASAGRGESRVTALLTRERQIRITVQGEPEIFEGTLPSQLTGDGATLRLTARGGAADGEEFSFTRRAGEPSGPPPDAVLKMRFYSFGAPFGIRQISPIEFDASVSRGDGLVHFIEFGDGESAAAAKAVHPIEKEGRYTARLTVVDRLGRADIETLSFEVQTLLAPGHYNEWENFSGSGGEPAVLTVELQNGTSIAGTLSYLRSGLGALRYPYTGIVEPDGNVRLILTESNVVLTGTLALGLTYSENTLKLTYLNGARTGQTLIFHLRAGY